MKEIINNVLVHLSIQAIILSLVIMFGFVLNPLLYGLSVLLSYYVIPFFDKDFKKPSNAEINLTSIGSVFVVYFLNKVFL